jgi:primase-polymerase (primpol)-like protein
VVLWNSSNIHEKQQNTTVRTVPKSNRKTTKYHTVRPVPTSMKNNKIPHCQDSSNKKKSKYHTVRTVPTSMKNNKIPHCQASSNIYEKQQNTTLSEQFQKKKHTKNCPDCVALCYFS